MHEGATIDTLGWPRELLLVRHGQSAGNVARDRALAEGHAVIDIQERDIDVPLSELGERQARTLGTWWKDRLPAPDVVFSSPYVRAEQTAALTGEAAGWNDPIRRIDERLREKEFGVLDRLTRTGIEQRYPDQAEMRKHVGKFYFRPPGGESWTDVVLRLRSFMDSLGREFSQRSVTIVTHQAVILCFRYIIENLTEKELLAIDSEGDVANCSITSYRLQLKGPAPGLKLEKYNFVAPLEEAGETVTRVSDVPVAPK